MSNRSSNSGTLPVLFGFFIMGFVDVVGISTSYVKQDFGLSDTLANMLPLMVFLWFAVFSVPTGLWMNRLGRKKTVLISMIFTIVAMLIPVFVYRFSFVLFSFALLGIGNTILQVSLNPLLTNVVRGDRLTSSLTLGQFIKAMASFSGPIAAGVAAGTFGNWKIIFPVLALGTLLSTLWLWLTPIREEAAPVSPSSLKDCLGLLKDKTILLIFLGILCIVGLDVGLNTTIPKFLMERCHIPLDKAGLGTSLYFMARTLGTFIGAIILVKVQGKKVFMVCMTGGLVAMLLMLLTGNLWTILFMVFILGLTIANIFSILFSMALQHTPERVNEISGLLIMGVSGGAVFPMLMGMASDATGTQTGGLAVLLAALCYLLWSGLKIKA